MKSAENSTFNNALSCLHYNEQLSKQISETIANIDRNIESLKDSQEYLLSQVKKEDQLKGSYVMQFLNGRNNRVVRKPYFITPLGLTPPTNQTQIYKISSGSIDFNELKREISKICTNKELEILKEAIGKNVLDLEKVRHATSSEKVNTRDINTLAKLSYVQLSEKCDSSMIDKIDWLGISSQNLKGRITPENCRKIWAQSFNPEFEVPKWTDYECQELLRIASEIGAQGKWVEIASKMPMKIQPYRCLKKWLELTSKMETCDEWDAEEDSFLCDVVSKVKDKDEYNRNTNWNKVALMVSNRSAKDCEKRWNSLQLTIYNRRFTDDEDYQLLLLIKRLGMDHWTDIAREMEQRTAEQCQRRYCEIVEDLHPWTYLEDRQLWLSLRPHFRELWDGNERIEEITNDLNLYKSVIKNFSGRCPLVIRHRYFKLCKWFSLWNRLYLCLNLKQNESSNSIDCQTTSLLSDICPEQTAIFAKIKTIILKTSFFEALRKALKANGSRNPDTDASELMNLCKAGDSMLLKKLINESTDQNLMEFLLFIVDLQNGRFIPRQFEKYIHRKNNVLKRPETADSDLRCLSSNVKAYEIKTAISNTLRKRLTELSNDSEISAHDKSCIDKLLNYEGIFISSLNYAVSCLQRTHDFNFVIRADLLERVLPQFLKLMVQYIYDQDNKELSKKSLTVHFTNQLASKREQIAELLIYRNTLPVIYKTYPIGRRPTCIISRSMPNNLSPNLTNPDKLKANAKNILKFLTSQQQHPISDESCFLTNTGRSDSLLNIKMMTPNRTTLNLLRCFLLQKQSLLETGEEEFSRQIRLKYDHPVNYLRAGTSDFEDDYAQLENSSPNIFDSKYNLLRNRIMSLLAIPCIMARISPFTTALTADRLHEVQNGEKYSSRISQFFNSVTHIPDSVYRVAGSTLFYGQQAPTRLNIKNITRKRKLLEFLEDDYEIEEGLQIEEKDSNEIVDISNNQPITRRVKQNWISIFLPDCERTVFIPKSIFQPFIKENFKLESVNGVSVDQIMNA